MPAAASEVTVQATDLKSEVERQIRAYADSIDQSDAVDTAALALAVHGMTKGGKKLSVGKSHALTAVLLNAEMMQVGLIESCESAIRAMHGLDQKKLDNVYGCCYWQGVGNSYFYTRAYDSENPETRILDWYLTDTWDRTCPRNAYDEALDWIAGFASLEMTFSQTKITADTITYKVTLAVSDRFDFATSGNSSFKDLISGIGALLFQEFDWEVQISFDLTVPYACSHSTAAYHWTYDTENRMLINDNTGNFQSNDVTRYSRISSDGTEKYYYILEEPIRLSHERPWVMEIDVRMPGVFAMTPLNGTCTSRPYWKIHGRRYIAVCDLERVGAGASTQLIYNYYGTNMLGYFSFTSTDVYTLRLENQLNSDGSNMIYLTVWKTAAGEKMMDRTPLDDYFLYDSSAGTEVLQNWEATWVSGKDLYISYIGNRTNPFTPELFELWVWENGEDGETESLYKASSVTAPTCTARGYTTYVCAACGHSKKADYVKALGHDYSDWTVLQGVTCTEEGIERRDCKTCGEYELRTTEPTGHDYNAIVTPPTCQDQGYTTCTCTTCGNSYVDAYIDPVDHRYEDGCCIWCGDVTCSVEWKSANATLTGSIFLNFSVVLSDNIVNDPTAFVRFTCADKVIDISVSEATISVSGGVVRYRFPCQVYAKQMTDTVTAQVMTANGPVGEPKSYSVAQYCTKLMSQTNDPELIATCKAMLNYGAAAQTNFNYRMDDLANAGLSEEDKVIATPDYSVFKHAIVGSEDGIKAASAKLVLDEDVAIRVTFQLTGNKTIDQYTFTIDGVVVQPVESGGRYYIELDGIAASKLNEFHAFSVGGLTVKYSALSYGYMIYNNSGFSAQLKALMDAMYEYHTATAEYVN